MMHRFKAVLLNPKGLDKFEIEGTIETDDEYQQISLALLETTEIESVFPRSIKRLGVSVCQIRLKSGDIFDVTESLDEIEAAIRKGNQYVFKSNSN